MLAVGTAVQEDRRGPLTVELGLWYSSIQRLSRVAGNGMVEFHEFVVVMSRRPYGLSGSEDELKTAFGPFDADDSGLMNVDEFRRAMTTMGERVTSEELDEILKHFTPDADGNIEYQGTRSTQVGLLDSVD